MWGVSSLHDKDHGNSILASLVTLSSEAQDFLVQWKINCEAIWKSSCANWCLCQRIGWFWKNNPWVEGPAPISDANPGCWSEKPGRKKLGADPKFIFWVQFSELLGSESHKPTEVRLPTQNCKTNSLMISNNQRTHRTYTSGVQTQNQTHGFSKHLPRSAHLKLGTAGGQLSPPVGCDWGPDLTGCCCPVELWPGSLQICHWSGSLEKDKQVTSQMSEGVNFVCSSKSVCPVLSS